MGIAVTPRALEVLRRALEFGRLDAERVGVRISLGRDGQVRTGFDESPEPNERTVDMEGIRLFVAPELAARDVTLDVADEHDRLVLR